MQFYTVGPLHTAMSAIFYLYALVCSKRPVGEKLHLHRKTNPVNWSRIGSKFGWYGKVNQKSSRLANVPFDSHMNKRQVQFRSTFRICWVSTGTCKCISLTLSQHIGENFFSCRSACAFHLLSPSILEKLSFPAKVPVFFSLFLDTSF